MAETSRLKKLLKEPLIHFLGGALLVFGFFWATGTNRDPADYTISINMSDIERMKAGWVQNFRRPPSENELDGLIDQAITEEIYYREALRLGMDRNDAVIRRRMFTKMRFLNNQDAAESDPSDAELTEWMEQNPEKYTLSSTYDLRQIYLGQAGEVDTVEAQQMLGDLNKSTVEPSGLGRSISLPGRMKGATSAEIARQFGEQFAAALEGLEAGNWAGPVPSGFGQHLVRVTAKVPSKSAVLGDVRQAVTNDWRAAQTAAQEAEALKEYRSQYDIQVAGRE